MVHPSAPTVMLLKPNIMFNLKGLESSKPQKLAQNMV
jgi:hypothetical protein